MASDTGSWEEEGCQDCTSLDGIDPLLELIGELIICCDSLGRHEGMLCSDCTCQLGYHVPCDSGECEFCGCDEIRRICASCDKPRVLSLFKSETRVCQFCRDFSPVRIQTNTRMRNEPGGSNTSMEDRWERSRAARMALKELTE